MDGPFCLSGLQRPVPLYRHPPLSLDPPSSQSLPAPPILNLSSRSATKTCEPAMPPFPLPVSFQSPLQVLKGAPVLSPFGKTRQLSPLDKSGVPVITPVRGPDPCTVALYQSLLRQHPTYHRLLESFVAPRLPPFFYHPAAALCEASLPLPSHHHAHPPQPNFPPKNEARNVPESRSPPHNKATPKADEEKGVEVKDELNQRAENLVANIAAIPDPFQQCGYGRKMFLCPQCRYTTDRRNNLKRHMLTMHQVSSKLLECCGVLFRTKAALREHALIFHYQGYICFYCGRRFCRKALLKRHLSVHNGQKEFICNVCDYATSHKSNLERHRRVHMRQDDDVSGADDDMMIPEGHVDMDGHVSDDEISVCSHDDDQEINVHSD